MMTHTEENEPGFLGAGTYTGRWIGWNLYLCNETMVVQMSKRLPGEVRVKVVATETEITVTIELGE